MPSLVASLSVFATLFALTASQQCFGVDGTKLDDTFAPCNPSAKHSGCCATKRSSGADLCLDSGLCMSTRGEFTGMIWQNGCTDSTGKDVACPKMCPINSSGGSSAVITWNVQQCDYGVYCCRASNDRSSCCNNASAPKVTVSSIGALQITSTPLASITLALPSSTPTQIVATAVSTGTPFDTTSAPATNDCTKEKRQTAVVGGTIGGIFGAVIVGLAGALLWLYKMEKRQRKLKEHYEEQFSQTAAYRRTIASTVSLMGSELGEMKSRPADT
ncbi:hypothetical protein IQ06DRAFT_270058 [Phaeosphaeriaceae sp. SRC1lsM3a]|nr:hypothetical protein IQ06DRAFT_270058 [Stagonospora sp. SRC1lsM3a]